MDFFAGLFGFILLTASVVLTYRWGIKPDREEKKRRAEQASAEMRRRNFERSRRRSAV
jgi:hypothetical protein